MSSLKLRAFHIFQISDWPISLFWKSNIFEARVFVRYEEYFYNLYTRTMDLLASIFNLKYQKHMIYLITSVLSGLYKY